MSYTCRFIIAPLILLFGCTPTMYQEIESTPTDAPEMVVRRLTSTPIPIPPTPTRPTITSRPSTITPTPDFVQTQEAARAVYQATQDAIPATIRQLQTPIETDSYLSPDGRKRAKITMYSCIDVGVRHGSADDEMGYMHQQLNLHNVDEGTAILLGEWTADCMFPGPGGFSGWFWSKNSRFFYYTNMASVGGEGCNAPVIGILKRFIRYDTDQESTVYMGGGEQSPDGTMIVTAGENGLVVWDAESGEEIGRSSRPDVDAEGYTGLVWSPNGTKLAYLTSTFNSEACAMTHRHLVEVDLSNSTQTMLVEMKLSSFGLVEIVLGDSEIILSNGWGNDQLYDRETGILSEVLPDGEEK